MVLELEEGWKIIHKGITKLINIHEGVPDESPMDADDYSKLYTTVYDMSLKPPPDYSKQVYERHLGVYNNYLKSKVLPAIQEKQDNVSMLQELVKRWASYKVLVTKISESLVYLDRYYIPIKGLPPLKDAGFGCFRKTVGEKMEVRVKDAVISLITRERESYQPLLKSVIEIFVELGNKKDRQNAEYFSLEIFSPHLAGYFSEFETTFLKETSIYFTPKDPDWTKEDYASKAEEWLQKEKYTISLHLRSGIQRDLLKIVQDVLSTALKKFLEKEHS